MEITKYEYKLLKYIYRKKYATRKQIEKKFNSTNLDVPLLLRAHARPINDDYHLNDEGIKIEFYNARYELTRDAKIIVEAKLETRKQRMSDRIFGFVAGVATTVIASLILDYLSILMK